MSGCQVILLVLAALITAAVARPGLQEPGDYNEVQPDPEHNPHPRYSFDYSVHDPHSGDVKSQWETRDGDVVKGAYSVLDADGALRTVQYASVGNSGFHAVVHKTYPAAPHEVHDDRGEQLNQI